MALSGSMFLFEILIKDIKSLKDCKDYRIVGHFENIFQFNINNPKKDMVTDLKKTRAKQKTRVRISKSVTKKPPAKIKLHTGQSILIINKTSSLISKMKEYPLELFLCKNSDPDSKIASTRIQWSNLFLNYLCKLTKKPDSLPPIVEGSYNLYDEVTSKRIAIIELSIKLTYLSNKVTSRFRSLSEDKHSTFLYTQINSKPISLLSNIREPIKNKQSSNPESENSVLAITKCLEQHHRYEISKAKDLTTKQRNNKDDEISLISEDKELKTNHNKNNKINSSLKIIKSEVQIVSDKQKTLKKCKSYSSIYCKNEKNVFQYIFGNPKHGINEKVYQVGYFTVENDDSDPDSIKVSTEPRSSTHSARSSSIKQKFRFKKCDSKCQMDTAGLCSESLCSTDLPEEAAHLITVTKCKAVDCDHKKYRELPSPPDERILLDLENAKTPCCAGFEVKEKIEEVVGGVSAKLKIGEDPCFCTCECTFGFTKKTTYCNVCGGYETVGEDLARKPAQEMPIPCPIFHKLIDKNKLKTYSTSGSESKKRGDDQRSMKAGSAQRALEKKHTVDKKDVESEKDSKKGKKKKKDDRFKFNYGYKGIPPQIGHSKCALPCTGTLANVPRKMGWLWTAEDIPGMKVHDGWKPGAVSKKLLRTLNKAKSRKFAVKEIKRTRRIKKLIEDKPTLKISKKDGQYCIELQPTADNPEEPNSQYTPLIYKIESENNKAKMLKRDRLRKRLTKVAVKKVWSDPFHPDICEMTCFNVFNEAIGVTSLDETDNIKQKEDTIDSCSCEDEEVSSNCSSSDIDWEMYFTPPIIRYQASQRDAGDSLVM